MTRFPAHLPAVSAGFAALSPAARAAGRRAGERVAAALSAQLGGTVELACRALPAVASPAPGMVRLGLALEAVPAAAVLEVEASLAIGLVDLLTGGAGLAAPGLSLTPVERSALELLVLVALSGAAEDAAIADRLAPRLSAECPEPGSPLLLETAVSVGEVRGLCRLLLPPAALRCVGGPGELPAQVAAWTATGWLSSGGARLAGVELASLQPGDVLILDERPSPSVLLHLPGLRLRGRLEGEHFFLEDLAVDPSAADLSLELTVEIARVSLTLGDLSRLEPGGALPLHAPRDGRVVLRLGERPVARGQLVEIDGGLGVRIERLEGRP